MGKEWKRCTTSDSRDCWLKHTNGSQFSITTNYEKLWPKGILRTFELNVTEKHLDLDGVVMKWGKVFNDSYPGPWIEACWGDEIEVKVFTNRTT